MLLRELIEYLNLDSVDICRGSNTLYSGSLSTYNEKKFLSNELLDSKVSFAGKRKDYFVIYLD